MVRPNSPPSKAFRRLSGVETVSLMLAIMLGWAAVIAYFASADGHLDAGGHALGRDFVNYWTAGQLVRTGDLASIFDPAAFLVEERSLFDPRLPLHFWSYPPPMLFLVAPLGLVGYGAGYVLWIAISFGALLLAAQGFGRNTLLLMLMLALSPAVAANVILGQNGFVTAALMIGGVSLLDRRPFVAGLLLGLLVLKPHLGLLLPVALLAERRWTTIAATAATAVLVCGLSVLVFGLQPWRDFVSLALPMQTAMMNQGTGPFQWMMPSAFMAARLLGLGGEGAWLAQLPFLLVAAIATWMAWRSGGSPRQKAAVLFAATFLASPQSFLYDLVPLALAALLIIEDRDDRPPLWALVAYALPLLLIPLNMLPLPIAPLLIGAVVIVAVGRTRRAAPQPHRSLSF